MTVRPASRADERAQVRDVARFIAPRIAAGKSWLVILACVSRWFPRRQFARRARGLRLP